MKRSDPGGAMQDAANRALSAAGRVHHPRPIVRTPGVQGGTPCLAGTRWSTATVLGFANDLKTIQCAFPHLTREQIETAIRYEQSWQRRGGRVVWRGRRRLGAMLLGVSVEDAESV